MEILIAGILLWSVVHLIPSVLPDFKTNLKNKFGENGFKLLFTILIILSIFLIVYGWRHSTTTVIYQLPSAATPIAVILMLVAFILFVNAILPTRLLRMVRHPQLMFIISWSLAHLLVNGDSRSIVLFAGMGLWAILEIIFINKRDGDWVKSAIPGLSQELKSLALSLILFVVAIIGHHYLAGVSLQVF